MGINYKHLFLIVFYIVLGSCDSEEEPLPDYGEEYFQMECYWHDPAKTAAIWRCSEDVTSDLVSGYLLLELHTPTELYFCGENLVLNSEIDIYDNLIALLTEDNFECLHIGEDKKKGNQLDWSWSIQDRLLQIIWRPDGDGSDKMMSLVISEGGYYEDVPGIVYYKILSAN